MLLNICIGVGFLFCLAIGALAGWMGYLWFITKKKKVKALAWLFLACLLGGAAGVVKAKEIGQIVYDSLAR